MQDSAFSNGPSGHSADVRIRLLVQGAAFDVAQVGGGRLIFPTPILLPGGPQGTRGEVVLSIDGNQRRWVVDLKPQREPSRLVEGTFREAKEVGIAGDIHG